VVEGVQSAYQAAVNNEDDLRAAVERQKALVLQQKDIGVQYGILSREANTYRQLYNTVLQRMKETEVAADLSASNIFVVDKAAPPRRHSHPKRLADLLISAILGLVAGIGIAFFRESLDNTLKSPQEVERFLRLPNLAILPDLTGTGEREPVKLNAESRARLLSRANGNANTTLVAWCAESYRTLRNSVLLSQAGGPPRVVLITSALDSEGKTGIAVNTAMCFARTAIKVLLIDADLRRSRCHEMLEVNNDLGLSEVLTGQAQVENTIITTSFSGLSFLPAGTLPPDPAELVGSKKMQEILEQLREAYDFIVIDSAPTMLVSDAIPLSAMVDGTLMVVNSQETPRQAVIEACSRLKYVGAKILGVVLNRVDINGFDFLYGNYYFGRYENSYYKNGHEARA
jgi:succinoglycan biosynthesis transport protein ExoP